eukprot:CCRYP_000448-RA/>CCRYP_000448-RA protein AED:0.00 eAED:0.00 QI:154/1/0.5/1/0/0/2/0/57
MPFIHQVRPVPMARSRNPPIEINGNADFTPRPSGLFRCLFSCLGDLSFTRWDVVVGR